MPERKINVAHFIGSLHIGGAENQVVLLANALDATRFGRHVVVMCENDVGFRCNLSAEIGYYNIGYRTWNAPAAMYRLYRYLVHNRIDVLHCHMYHAVVKGALAGSLAAVPVIVTSEHGKNPWKKWHHHAVEKYFVNHLVDRRVAVSEDIRQIRMRYDGVKPEAGILLPNCVDTEVPIKDNRQKPRVIGTLGRLVDAKDFPTLIHALRLLREQGRDVRLIIAGEGGERSNLERLVADLSLGGFVSLPGIQPAREFLESIDLFAMSSRREGVPVALLEAMAHGLPVAATAVGGIPETLQAGVEGLLCPAGDPAALAANIARLIDDEALRAALGQGARDKVVRCYGAASVVDRWAQLYTELFCAKRSQSCAGG